MARRSENIHLPLNLTITQGDDREVPFIFEDDSGVPADISGWDFYFTVKASEDDLDDDALVALDPVDFVKSDSTGGGTTDMITFMISRTATELMEPGEYHQDLQVVVDGRVKTIGKGTLVIETQVTRRV